MAGDRSNDVKRQRGRGLREETPQMETVGAKLRVWRDQGTNEILIEAPVFRPGTENGGLITLSARDARHLANSLLLFAAETESVRSSRQ